MILSLLAAVLVPAVLSQDGCTETIDSDNTVSGEWAAGCTSNTAAPGEGDGERYARFYTFTLEESAEVSIVLESSDADTYLYLREGQSKAGTAIHVNDDDGGTDRSRIQEILSGGSYTIEATTYANGETGNFTLSVSGLSGPGAGSRRVLVAEPGPGHFHHDTSKEQYGTVFHSLDTDIYDATVSGWFENPYSASDGSFYYGFYLRNTIDDRGIVFVAYSNRNWFLNLGGIVYTGSGLNLRTDQSQWNYLSISVVGKYAIASVNGVLLRDTNDSLFDVGSRTGSGNVLVRGNGKDGTITHYDSVRVYEIVPSDLVADELEVMEIASKSAAEFTSKDAIFEDLKVAVPNP